MKCNSRLMTWIWLAAASLFFLFAQGAVAAIGTIAGSKHDFSSTGTSTYKGASNQVCVYCHAPHNVQVNVPLWNRAANTSTYTIYSSTGLDGVTGQPGSVSKLCLSCHDGTVAIDAFGGSTGTATNKIPTTSSANLGGATGLDLSNDHPVGITYTAATATADGSLYDPTTHLIGSGPLATFTIDAKMLSATKVECASCHDVHNSTAGTAVESKLLRVTTVGSALCLACHKK